MSLTGVCLMQLLIPLGGHSKVNIFSKHVQGSCDEEQTVPMSK